MKTVFLQVIALLCLCVVCRAQVQRVYLVEVTDIDKTSEYKVMTDVEYKALEKEIMEESRLSMKALTEAAKEWKEDETTTRKTFPKAAIGKRSVKIKGTFTDAAKAEEKLQQQEERLSESQRREEDRNKNLSTVMGKTKEQEEKAKLKDAERDAVNDQARELYRKKLADLMRATAPAADAAKQEPDSKPAPAGH